VFTARYGLDISM